jgi:tetratricopeptide (TPR) repeat protein
MSRLADSLSKVDQEGARPRPAELGSLPGLVARRALPRAARWRMRTGLVMLVIMAIGAAGVLLLRRGGPEPAPAASPAPPAMVDIPRQASVTARATSRDERRRIVLDEGAAAARQGRLAEAAGLLREALEIDGTDAEAWNNLGVVLTRLGERGQGIEAFRSALRADRTHVEAHRNLAVALDLLGRQGEAGEHYRTFLQHADRAHPDRAQIQRRVGQLAEARR